MWRILIAAILAAASFVVPHKAQGETMAIRYFIVPIERHTDAGGGVKRGPQHFAWKFDQDPANSLPSSVQWSMIDYGLVDVGVVAANVTAAQVTTMTAFSDVLVIPANINNNLNAAAVSAAQTFLENINVPAGWVSTSLTYRQVLRTITGMFLYMQRVTAIAGLALDWQSVSLGTQVQNIPLAWRNAMQQAADELHYDYTGITGTSTLRQVLKSMADDWGAAPIYFGITTL